jgi:hypothetical protein
VQKVEVREQITGALAEAAATQKETSRSPTDRLCISIQDSRDFNPQQRTLLTAVEKRTQVLHTEMVGLVEAQLI